VSLLRTLALGSVAAGAAGSVALMLHVGRRNPSLLLLGMFVLWVLAPFAAGLLADIRSRRWQVLQRATLHCAMIVLTIGSLVVYGIVALGPPRPKPASFFLIVPPASAVLAAVAVFLARRTKGGQPS
jgi:hypothetical protein